jgi:MoaA/NifB/PqqE/SkfB family radical SAM enzyme
MNNLSYTSANAFPIKTILNQDVLDGIKLRKIFPKHIQLNITNKCMFDCSFCSCKERDKSQELSFNQVKDIVDRFRELGTKAITMSGGGEPLCHPKINDIINYIASKGILIGLVTNGMLLNKLNRVTILNLTWCRISLSGESKLDLKKIENNFKIPIDWAFSYVVDSEVNKLDPIETAVNYVNKYSFTHIRIVDDILKTNDATSSMEAIKHFLQEAKINDSNVIYQGRKKYFRGNKGCLISLLKPSIGPDGNWYPCCGIQYSKKENELGFPKDFSMGSNYESIVNNQLFFDGSVCDKCYYKEYNVLLCMLYGQTHLNHLNFI